MELTFDLIYASLKGENAALREAYTKQQALILQLVEALEVPARDVCRVAHHKKQDRHEYGDACPLQARHDAAIVAGRAWLEGKPCA